MGEPQSIPQSVIYELINETINKEAFSIACPSTPIGILWYIIKMPLTHTQYVSIPSPLSKRNSNYYPLTLFMSTIWIFFYAYIIVWFTYDVTTALNMHFSIIPMFLYPFGVALRDIKKFKDFILAIEVFQQELPDQEISLAETYAPQIFQMTGLMGFSWMFFVAVNGKNVEFINSAIEFQVPILMTFIFIKYVILLLNKFKSHRRMFKQNIISYVIFLSVGLSLDYKDELIETFFG